MRYTVYGFTSCEQPPKGFHHPGHSGTGCRVFASYGLKDLFHNEEELPMKKTAVLILTIIFFLTAMTAFAETGDRFSSGSDPVALIVDNHEVTQSELESAAVLSVFESALQCAGYGYAFDIMDPLNIEDEMDKLVFDLESWYVTQDLAASMGLYPPGKDAGEQISLQKMPRQPGNITGRLPGAITEWLSCQPATTNLSRTTRTATLSGTSPPSGLRRMRCFRKRSGTRRGKN